MKRFQNRASESYISLPVSAVYAFLIWIAAGLVTHGLWVPMVLMGVCTYLMAEMNNRNTLLRIRSRMMSCVYLFLATLQISFAVSWQLASVQAISLLCLCLMLSIYRDRNNAGAIFTIFLLMSIASMIWVRFLYFVPIVLLLLSAPLYAMSLKGLSAAIMGLILPYWLSVPYLVYIQDYNPLIDHFVQLADVSIFFNYTGTTIGQVVMYALLLIMFLIGWSHFVRNSYKDKLKTRNLFNFFMIQALILFIVTPLAPAIADYTLSILVLIVSPVIAHFFALTEMKATNITFIATIIIVMALTIVGVATDIMQVPLIAN